MVMGSDGEQIVSNGYSDDSSSSDRGWGVQRVPEVLLKAIRFVLGKVKVLDVVVHVLERGAHNL